jgi:phosphatidylglycerophosphate synthase
VPNALTVLRLVMAGLLPFVAPAWRVPCVLVAGVSDALDGWVARRFHATSVLGALLDGVADKAFVLAALVTLWHLHDVAWWQAGLLLARDLCVGVTFATVLWHREWSAFAHMAARLPGKLTTMALFAWFVAVLWPRAHAIAPVLFWIAAVCSLWAAVDYGRRFVLLTRAAVAARSG